MSFVTRYASRTLGLLLPTPPQLSPNRYKVLTAQSPTPLTKQTVTASKADQESEKASYRVLYAAVGFLLGIQLADAAFKKKGSDTAGIPTYSSPQPTTSLISGTYKVTCYSPIPSDMAHKIEATAYKDPASFPPDDLAYVQVTHYGVDGSVHLGGVVIPKKLEHQVLEVIPAIYAARFPIEQMPLDTALPRDASY